MKYLVSASFPLQPHRPVEHIDVFDTVNDAADAVADALRRQATLVDAYASLADAVWAYSITPLRGFDK